VRKFRRIAGQIKADKFVSFLMLGGLAAEIMWLASKSD